MIDKNLLMSLRSVIDSEDQITVIVRKNPTLDSFAGGLALYLALFRAGKKVNILCPTEPIVEQARVLVGINKVTTKMASSGKDLTIVLPYEKGRIDKISYNIEGESIHLVVKAGQDGLGFTDDQIKFLKTGGDVQGLLILVDVSTIDDLSGLLTPQDLEGRKIVNIGRAANQIVSNSMNFVNEEASSISEIVAKILSDIGASLERDSAQNLMVGINSATSNLQAGNTSPLAFEMTGFLMRYGALRDIDLPAQAGEKEDIKEDKIELKDLPTQAGEKKEEKKDEPPLDWLTPKIYKGSTLP